MDFNEHNLADRLSGEFIGNTVHFFKELDSTNIYASRIARNGTPEGTVVIADCQTRGKGRLNRVWQSPSRKNIYTSIILKPSIKPSVAPQLTLTAGVAAAEFLSRYCPGAVTLKWPNDIQVRKNKICGILTEMRTTGGTIDFVVIGIGININMRKEEFDEEFREASTSLREETGRDISRVDFAVGLYQSFEKWYEIYKSEGFASIKDRWLEYSEILDKKIQINHRGNIQKGKVLGIDECGALLLFDEEGKTKPVLAGDVSLIGDK